LALALFRTRGQCFDFLPCGYSPKHSSDSAFPRAEQADTRRAVRLCLTASARQCCACTHYLVFKEPDAQARSTRHVPPRGPAAVPSDRPFPSALGEPYKVTIGRSRCQPLIAEAIARDSE